VTVAMTRGGDCASAYSAEIIAAWAQVCEHAGGVSLFRIDSLVWQVAADVYAFRADRNEAASRVRTVLSGYGATADAAALLASELTFAL